jgi:3-oxoadipate enol-lactonase
MTRPRVVLLHAFPLDCRMWSQAKRALEEAGYGVSAPDLPGPEAEPTLTAWADRVLALADGSLVPVGASMGGYLAFELWRRARGRITALALVSTRASGESEESRKARDENIRILHEGGVGELWERLQPKLFAPGASAATRGLAREIALEQGSQRLAAALEAMRDREDATGLLGEIDVPVLVVAGEQDAVIPPGESELLTAALSNARLLRIPGAGHLAPLERPDEVSAALRSFLSEVIA